MELATNWGLLFLVEDVDAVEDVDERKEASIFDLLAFLLLLRMLNFMLRCYKEGMN